MRCARYGLIAILLNILFLPLNALAVRLDELVNFGESITAGNKLFTNFSGSLMSGAAHPVLLDQIEVTGLSAGDTHGLSSFAPCQSPEHPQDSTALAP